MKFKVNAAREIAIALRLQKVRDLADMDYWYSANYNMPKVSWHWFAVWRSYKRRPGSVFVRFD